METQAAAISDHHTKATKATKGLEQIFGKVQARRPHPSARRERAAAQTRVTRFPTTYCVAEPFRFQCWTKKGQQATLKFYDNFGRVPEMNWVQQMPQKSKETSATPKADR